jgi:hypothetical protein
MKLTFTNGEIYQMTLALNQSFDNLDIRIPAKANFYIQKNAGVIAAAAQEIEKSRMEVIQHYGELNEDGNSYNIAEDKRAAANKELEELFNITQELEIYQFSIDALGDLEFTQSQMQAIMFMIED